MFRKLQENPTINGIMCVPYSNLILNDNTKQREQQPFLSIC